MSTPSSTTSQRLAQISHTLRGGRVVWDPDSDSFPLRGELPSIPNAPKDAAWFWGEDDYFGRLNLLTPKRVAAAAKEIKSGEIVPVNLPLNVPNPPGFGREPFEHKIKTLSANYAYDDLYTLNTQSGTQWDGFRHFAHLPSATFYNGTKGEDIVGPKANLKCSIHHWSNHGIAGRGILLDYASFAESQGIKYSPYESHSISLSALSACASFQNFDLRPAAQGGNVQIGDMLFVRSGWTKTYRSLPADERARLALRPHSRETGQSGQQYAGVQQSEEMLDWIHDCYFAAVAGDAPAFEVWPTKESFHLHEYILALWGMPLGEMLDLERLAEICKKKRRWTFFFSSMPANVPGGVSSHVNGQAIF